MKAVKLIVCSAVCCSAFQQATFVSNPIRRLDTGLSSSIEEEVQVVEDDILSTPGKMDLPPILQGIVDERQDFQLNLGKAMDTLKSDYPEIINKMPEFSIYHDDIHVVDPSGVQLTGLKNYKASFQLLQTVIGLFYVREKSGITMRMVFDATRSEIRISWNAMLWPKIGTKPLYVDGISCYQMDSSSGKIMEHRIERLIVNGSQVEPPYGILGLLRPSEEVQGRSPGIPVF